MAPLFGLSFPTFGLRNLAPHHWGLAAGPPRGAALARRVAEKGRKAPPLPAAAGAVAAVAVGKRNTRAEIRKDEARWPNEESVREFLQSKAAENRHDWARAVRHSGRQGWWQVLLQAYDRESSTCYYVTTMATAISDALEKMKKVSKKQKDQALDLVGRLWRDLSFEEARDEDLLYALSSSLKLCVLVKTPRALGWGEQLWQWSEDEELQKNDVALGNYLQLQEVQGNFDTVDQMLRSTATSEHVEANEKMLGALLELAAQRQDWKRAEDLWHLIVDSLHVEPNYWNRVTMAKVYFMSGRLTQAEQELEEEALPTSKYSIASDFLQLLLIMCHAAPSGANLQKLSTFIRRKENVFRPGFAEEEWQQMVALAERLADGNDVPSFKELLVTLNAKRSVMARWKDREYGSLYID